MADVNDSPRSQAEAGGLGMDIGNGHKHLETRDQILAYFSVSCGLAIFPFLIATVYKVVRHRRLLRRSPMLSTSIIFYFLGGVFTIGTSLTILTRTLDSQRVDERLLHASHMAIDVSVSLLLNVFFEAFRQKEGVKVGERRLLWISLAQTAVILIMAVASWVANIHFLNVLADTLSNISNLALTVTLLVVFRRVLRSMTWISVAYIKLIRLEVLFHFLLVLCLFESVAVLVIFFYEFSRTANADLFVSTYFADIAVATVLVMLLYYIVAVSVESKAEYGLSRMEKGKYRLNGTPPSKSHSMSTHSSSCNPVTTQDPEASRHSQYAQNVDSAAIIAEGRDKRPRAFPTQPNRKSLASKFRKPGKSFKTTAKSIPSTQNATSRVATFPDRPQGIRHLNRFSSHLALPPRALAAMVPSMSLNEHHDTLPPSHDVASGTLRRW